MGYSCCAPTKTTGKYLSDTVIDGGQIALVDALAHTQRLPEEGGQVQIQRIFCAYRDANQTPECVCENK